jgi:hypothetical protein
LIINKQLPQVTDHDLEDVPQKRPFASEAEFRPEGSNETEDAVKSHVGDIATIKTLQDSASDASPSYASRLPPELVAAILLALQVPFCGGYTRVCRTWRNVAISTPRLWTDIALELTNETFDAQMLHLQTAIGRSGILPLSIWWWFAFVDLNDISSIQKLNPMTTLAPYVSCIRNMNLSLVPESFRSLCQIPAGSLPLLETCEIHLWGDASGSDQQYSIKFFEGADRLRVLDLNDKCTLSLLDLKPLRLPSPCHLVELCLHGRLCLTELLSIMRRCPNVEELYATASDFSPSEHLPDNIIFLPRLRQLDLTADEWDLGDAFFSHFTTPSLNKFRASFMATVDSDWPFQSFNTFLLRSSAPLKYLYLKGISMECEHFLECLRAVPSLVDLSINDVDYLDGLVLDALTFHPYAPENLLPCLQIFLARTVFDAPGDTMEKSFATMVESRWWSDVHSVDVMTHHGQVSRLTKAELSFAEDRESLIDVNARRRIRTLQEEGLDVSLH